MPLLPPPLPDKQPAESSKDLQSVDALLILPNRRILLHTYTDRLKGDAGYSLENRKHSARGPAIDSRTGRPDGKAPPGRPALCSRKKKSCMGTSTFSAWARVRQRRLCESYVDGRTAKAIPPDEMPLRRKRERESAGCSLASRAPASTFWRALQSRNGISLHIAGLTGERLHKT